MASNTDNEIRAVGGSMSPFILSGSRLFVEHVEPGCIRVGDVVCFIGDGGQGVTHRVLQIADSSDGKVLHVRGDAQTQSETVPETAVLYVVKRVSHRRLAYDLDGPLGKLFARISLAEDRKYALAKAFVGKSWNFIRYIHQNLL